MWLLFIAGVLLFVGVSVTLTNVPNLRRRARILAIPTSPIAQAAGGGPVEVKGRIVSSDQGVVQAPFTGRHAVWMRVTVSEKRRRGRTVYWKTIVDETCGRTFYIDDGSGQYARVLPDGATVILDRDRVASSGTFHAPPPALQAFLHARGLSSQNLLGFNKAMQYSEEVLAPGDPVCALGPSRRDPGPPVSDGYRMVPTTQLVMVRGAGPDAELILTNKSEQQLVSRLLQGFVFGVVCAGVGLIAAVAGVAALVM